MLKALGDWNGAAPRAVATLRRPDLVKQELTMRGTGISTRMLLEEQLRRPPEGVTATLPATTMLVLDQEGALHLLEVKQGVRPHAGETLIHWPAGTASVSVRPRRGSGFWAVEIADSQQTLLLAAPCKASSGAKAALKLIEQASASRQAA